MLRATKRAIFDAAALMLIDAMPSCQRLFSATSRCQVNICLRQIRYYADAIIYI